METVLKDDYYSSLCLCVYVEIKRSRWSISLSIVCMVIMCFSQKFAKGGVCWVFGVGCNFGKINSVAGCWIRCLKHCIELCSVSLEVLLARQACAFPIYGIYISLSWIISCAKRKALFSKQIFCLEIGSEIIVKIYFQNISNLLRYGLFLFCELDVILVQIFWSPCCSRRLVFSLRN